MDNAEQWAKHFGLFTTFTAEYDAHGGRKIAGILCRAWVSTMEHLLEFSLPDYTAPFEYEDLHVLSWEEPAEFQDLVATGGLRRETGRRINYLRNLKPGHWRPLDD